MRWSGGSWGRIAAGLMFAGMACTAGAQQAAPMKVAFVYVGPIGDGGWTYSHDLGRRAMEKELAGRVTTSYVEKVPETAEAEAVFRRLAREGNKLIIGTTFGYMEPMLKVAKEFPDVRFLHAGGYKTAPNLRTYESRMYEGAYLAGMIAGGMAPTGNIGVVASIPIPEVVRNINAFAIGARAVNPGAVTKVVWVGDWYNPPKEAQAAEALIQGGSDVLLQNTDSAAVLQTAQRLGKKAFGWDSDMTAYAPGAHLGSVVSDWSRYYAAATRAVLEGRWDAVPASAWHGMREGMVDFVSFSAQVHPDLRARVQEARAALRDGTLAVWKGPLYESTGQLAVVAGGLPDDKWLGGMNFYVQGVAGRVPGSSNKPVTATGSPPPGQGLSPQEFIGLSARIIRASGSTGTSQCVATVNHTQELVRMGALNDPQSQWRSAAKACIAEAWAECNIRKSASMVADCEKLRTTRMN